MARPSEQRRPRAALKALGSALERVLANAGNLSTIWSALAPLIGLAPTP